MPNKIDVKEAHNKFGRHFSQLKRNMKPTKEETQTPTKRQLPYSRRKSQNTNSEPSTELLKKGQQS